MHTAHAYHESYTVRTLHQNLLAARHAAATVRTRQRWALTMAARSPVAQCYADVAAETTADRVAYVRRALGFREALRRATNA